MEVFVPVYVHHPRTTKPKLGLNLLIAGIISILRSLYVEASLCAFKILPGPANSYLNKLISQPTHGYAWVPVWGIRLLRRGPFVLLMHLIGCILVIVSGESTRCT